MSSALTYIIINKNEITTKQWEACQEQNLSRVRKSNDGQLYILKYKGYHFLLFYGIKKYSKKEMRDYLESSAAFSQKPY